MKLRYRIARILLWFHSRGLTIPDAVQRTIGWRFKPITVQWTSGHTYAYLCEPDRAGVVVGQLVDPHCRSGVIEGYWMVLHLPQEP